MKVRFELKVFGGGCGVHDLYRGVNMDVMPVPGIFVEPAAGFSATSVQNVCLCLVGNQAELIVRLQA